MQPDCRCPVCGSTIDDLPVTLLPERGMVIANGMFAVLTGREMLLLERLVEKFPRIVSKDELLEWMYQLTPDEEPEIKIIDVFVCKARKKLTPIGVRIDTAWGNGYALALDRKPVIVKQGVVA